MCISYLEFFCKEICLFPLFINLSDHLFMSLWIHGYLFFILVYNPKLDLFFYSSPSSDHGVLCQVALCPSDLFLSTWALGSGCCCYLWFGMFFCFVLCLSSCCFLTSEGAPGSSCVFPAISPKSPGFHWRRVYRHQNTGTRCLSVVNILYLFTASLPPLRCKLHELQSCSPSQEQCLNPQTPFEYMHCKCELRAIEGILFCLDGTGIKKVPYLIFCPWPDLLPFCGIPYPFSLFI